MKLFDNIVVLIFVFCLPLTYALTIDIAFPLKVSEIALFILFFLVVYASRFKLPFNSDTFQVFIIFLAVTLVSTAVNVVWPYRYELSTYASRFGYTFDSIMKFFYLVLSLLAFIVSANAFYLNEHRYIRAFLAGGILASLYGWYLFFSGLLHLPVFLLPGIEEPQIIGMSFGEFVRSGTFKEGNYMGLFILYCIIFCFYTKRFKLGYFFMATMLTTFSTIGLVCTVFFLIGYYLKTGFTRRRILKMAAVFTLLVLGFLALLPNEDFRVYVLSKIPDFERKSTTENFANVGEFSRADRLNSTAVAIKIALANPVFGVGISNYSRHYNHFNNDPRFVMVDKRIPNNVYLELFSEIGILGLLVFTYLLYLLYRKTRFDTTGTIRPGYLASLIYFVAFPTFSILYIWLFFGFITTLPAKFKQSQVQ